MKTLGLAFVPYKSYQFNKPICTADGPRNSACVSIVSRGTLTKTQYTCG